MQNPLKSLFRKRPPLTEVAAVDGFSASARPGLWGALSTLTMPGEGLPGGYGTLRRMQHDPQVRACLSTKKFAVLSRGWEVHAASDTPEDQAVADFIRACFNDMRGSLLDNLYDVLDALALGVSILEINYRLYDTGPYAGMVGLANLKSKDPEDFVIETDAFLNITGLCGSAGASYDPEKFILYSYMPAYENPLGTSDLRAAHRPWQVKNQLLTWWAKYLEKFGMPTVMGSYDAGKGYGTDQQRELLSIVAQVHNESAVVLPNDMSLSLLETQRAQGADFNEMIGYLDRAIAKSILGQTLTSDSTGGGSTYALGQVHMDVLRFFLQKLQRDLEQGVVMEQIIKRLLGYNFPPGTACPNFSLGTIDDGQLAAAGTLIKDLVAGKVIAPEEPWIRSYLGLPAREQQQPHS
jgi:phage gp29-like protein